MSKEIEFEDDCYDHVWRVWKCNKCVFASHLSMACANPNIRLNPPLDAYFKPKDSELTELEKDTIDQVLPKEEEDEE